MQPYCENKRLVFSLLCLLPGVKAQSSEELTIIITCAVVGVACFILIIVVGICILRFLKKRDEQRQRGTTSRYDSRYADLTLGIQSSQYDCLDPNGRLPDTVTTATDNPPSQASDLGETPQIDANHKEIVKGNPGSRFVIIHEGESVPTTDAPTCDTLSPGRLPRRGVQDRHNKHTELILGTPGSHFVIANEGDSVVESQKSKLGESHFGGTEWNARLRLHGNAADNKAFSMEDNTKKTAPPRPSELAFLQKKIVCRNLEQPADQGVQVVFLKS